MSVDSSTTSKTVPLFLRPHQENEDINYMRHILKEWDIGNLKPPIYFYQPTVKPNSEGGTVKDTYSGPRKKKDFFEVKKEYIKRPEEEPWMMYTSDGTLFKGAPDTLSSTAVIFPSNTQFDIQLVNNSIRIKDGKEVDGDIDIEVAEKRRKAESEMKQRNFKKNFKFMYDDLERKEKQRINQAREMREAGDEDIARGDGDDGDEEHDDFYNADENAADVDDARSDDDEDIGDAIDDMFADMPEELVDLEGSNDEEESQSSSDEDEEDEDGNKTGKKKKKKKGDQKDKAAVTSQGENQSQAAASLSTEKIVDDILGPQVLKEDELVRYMMDVGYVTSKQMYNKFKDRLKTTEQKIAFKDLAKKRLQSFEDKGVKYFKLKERR